MKINIIPIPIGFELEANNVELKQGGYTLGSNEGCRVRCLFYTDNDIQTVDRVVIIPKEMVINWEDDNVIIDYVLAELHLTKAPEQEITML